MGRKPKDTVKIKSNRGQLRAIRELGRPARGTESFPRWDLELKDGVRTVIGLVRYKSFAGDLVHITTMDKPVEGTRSVMRWPICAGPIKVPGRYALVRGHWGRLCPRCEEILKDLAVLDGMGPVRPPAMFRPGVLED